MTTSHRARVEAMLARASARHAELLPQLPPEVQASLPVDAQGITEAIDFLAEAAGLSAAERRTLVRPHAVNPAVMHARVFGGAPLAEETIVGSFVDGARVRAGALAELADAIGAAVVGFDARPADQVVVARASEGRVVAGAADEHVVAVAAVLGQQRGVGGQ